MVVEREIESEEGTFFLTHSAGFETCVLLTYVKIINFFRSSSSSLQFIYFFAIHIIYMRDFIQRKSKMIIEKINSVFR